MLNFLFIPFVPESKDKSEPAGWHKMCFGGLAGEPKHLPSIKIHFIGSSLDRIIEKRFFHFQISLGNIRLKETDFHIPGLLRASNILTHTVNLHFRCAQLLSRQYIQRTGFCLFIFSSYRSSTGMIVPKKTLWESGTVCWLASEIRLWFKRQVCLHFNTQASDISASLWKRKTLSL